MPKRAESPTIRHKRKHKKQRSTSPQEPQMMTVQTDDGYTFYCDIEALKVSTVLNGFIKGSHSDKKPLRIVGMSHDTVQRVLWWMDNHREDQNLKDNDPIDETMDAWQRCFFNCTIDIILKLISAANYLNVRRLMVLGINKLAQIINEKFSEENPVRAIRDAFHIRAPDGSKNEHELDENVSRYFVFEHTIRSNENPSKIDVLDVGVTHLPPRRLECSSTTEYR